MFSSLLKTVILKLLNALGFEVHRKSSRSSLIEVLGQAKNIGLSPNTVIDVGAAYGEFTLKCETVFPDAKYILIEPLEEFKPFLNVVIETISNGEYIPVAATAKRGKITINIHPDLVGSSIYLESEDSSVNGVPRIVPAITLDSLINRKRIEPPYLMKIDVQGAELDILLGAEEILRNTEYVLLEVSFFEFFRDGPLFYDVMTFMKSRGFVPYDIFSLQYRVLDNALSQVDITFVKKTGLFRKYHYYATRRQREEQNRRFELLMRELSRRYKLK